MSMTTSVLSRSGVPLPLAPARPGGEAPPCEGCAEAEIEVHCDCCGREFCGSCWGEGDGVVCGVCGGRAWHDVPPEAPVFPAGLLLYDDDLAMEPAMSAPFGVPGPSRHLGRYGSCRRSAQ